MDSHTSQLPEDELLYDLPLTLCVCVYLFDTLSLSILCFYWCVLKVCHTETDNADAGSYLMSWRLYCSG